MAKVVVAMSGGVDSSVAAALLKEAGHQVIGVTMQIWPSDKTYKVDGSGGCCGISAIEDAEMVAYKLGIPHYVMNFRDIFAQKVIADFCREYSLGRTPNPCIRCNQYIKFGALLERALGLGADFVATGHYARVERNGGDGRYYLKKGVDRRKDQSYVLYRLKQKQLKHSLLPIGNLTKVRVREIARELGLSIATGPESQEICFVPDGDYSRFVRECVPKAVKPGPILDRQGNVLGEHHGIPFYTIGQRKKLDISASQPLYVTGIIRERNAIVVGNKEELYRADLIASRVNWIGLARLKQPTAAKAKIRYLHNEADAEIFPIEGGKVNVRFKELQMAITPGQAAVFYQGDTIIGGGTIVVDKEETERKEVRWPNYPN